MTAKWARIRLVGKISLIAVVKVKQGAALGWVKGSWNDDKWNPT
jgi:hypothetical protein